MWHGNYTGSSRAKNTQSCNFQQGLISQTSSRIAAEKFGKAHDRVLKDIRNLHCSEVFHADNFDFVEIIGKNAIGGPVNQSYYNITRDGLMFLVMGNQPIQVFSMIMDYQSHRFSNTLARAWYRKDIIGQPNWIILTRYLSFAMEIWIRDEEHEQECNAFGANAMVKELTSATRWLDLGEIQSALLVNRYARFRVTVANHLNAPIY